MGKSVPLARSLGFVPVAACAALVWLVASWPGTSPALAAPPRAQGPFDFFVSPAPRPPRAIPHRARGKPGNPPLPRIRPAEAPQAPVFPPVAPLE